jgi:quaternary ammonium compound-resistance protein SugE
MAWLYLSIAGMCEVVWALSMKSTEGFTRLIPSVVTISFMMLSIYFLNLSLRHIPVGIAYTVWTGIGAVGAILGSMLILKEHINIWQVLFMTMIVIGIIGVKLTDVNN